MISQTLARRYAQALLALGQEDGNFSRYGEELAAFAQAMLQSGLMEALSNPIYPLDTRKNLLTAVLERMGPSNIMANFLALLLDKARINHVEAINNNYQRLVDEVNNVQRATVITATAMSGEMSEQVKERLEKMTGKIVVLEIREDREIIGGLVAKVGDLTLDGSVKTQLNNLKESLIKG